MHRWSYIHTPKNKPYRYATITDELVNNVDNDVNHVVAIQRAPDNVRRLLTKGELVKSAEKFAKYLLENGIKKGDNVTILGPNTLEWIIGEVAILLSGAVSVHLTINTTDTEKTWKLINRTNCKALILDPGMENELENNISALLEKFQFSDTGIPHDSKLPFITLLRNMKSFPNFPSLQEVTLTNKFSYTLPAVYPEDTAIIFSTSGSTGDPKLIKTTHFAIVNGDGNYFEKQTIYADQLFSWSGGYPLSLVLMNTLVFTDSSLAFKSNSTRFILNVLKEEKCQSAILSPYFLTELLGNSDEIVDASWCLNTIFAGGQVVNKICANVIGKFCDHLVVQYGSTEGMTTSSGKTISNASLMETGNVGYPYAGVEIKIVDKVGSPIDKCQVGKILCRSQYVFQGYYDREDLTSEVLSRDGWFDTGDVGLINIRDELVIKGRVKDLISRGTREIVPSDIENIIIEMDDIEDVSVIAVPDQKLLEEICVCFTSRDNTTISANDVQEFCKTRFTSSDSYDGLGDMPRYFLHFNDLPLLSNGKLDKKALKEKATYRLNL